MRTCSRVILVAALIIAVQLDSTSVFAADESRPGRWYVLAIQGDIDAQYLLGVAYYTGEHHVQKDLSKAEEWLEKAHEGGHALALAKLAEVRRSTKAAEDGVDSGGVQAPAAARQKVAAETKIGKIEQLKAQYPGAVALAEAFLQKELEKYSDGLMGACKYFGINSGSDLLWTTFREYRHVNYPGVSGSSDVAGKYYSCLMFYGSMVSKIQFMVDLDAAEADGAMGRNEVFITADESRFCSDQSKDLQRSWRNGTINGSMVNIGFQPCVIATIKAIVPMAPYWNGSADYYHPDTRVEIGDWTLNKLKTRAHVSSSTDLLTRLSIECVRGPASLRISYWAESWKVPPQSMDQNGEPAIVNVRVDGGGWLEYLGRQWPALPFKRWAMDDEESRLASMIKRLQSGSRVSVRAYDGDQTQTYDFSLKGSKEALGEVVANCNRLGR